MGDVGLIVPAAGSGERLGAEVPKALSPVAGVPLLTHALRNAVGSGTVAAVAVAAPVGLTAEVSDLVAASVPPGVAWNVVEGGAERQDSVRSALAVLPPDLDIVLVHDAARCLAPSSIFRAVVAAVQAGHEAVVPGVPVVDTLKQVDSTGAVVSTVDRTALRAVQTPQGFRRDLLEQAHRAASPSGVTDDAGLVEQMGRPVHVVPGHLEAFKITHSMDVLMAEALLADRAAA